MSKENPVGVPVELSALVESISYDLWDADRMWGVEPDGINMSIFEEGCVTKQTRIHLKHLIRRLKLTVGELEELAYEEPKPKLSKPSLPKKRDIPEFVMMDGKVELRYMGNYKYFRDAGVYHINCRMVDGQLMSWRGDMKSIHRKPLTEITEEEWRKGNGQYAPPLKNDKNKEWEFPY